MARYEYFLSCVYVCRHVSELELIPISTSVPPTTYSVNNCNLCLIIVQKKHTNVMDFSQKKNSFFKKDFKIILKKFRFFLFQMVFITSIQSLKSSKLLWLPDMNELLLCFFFKLYIDCFTVLVTFEINSSSWAYFAQ